MEFVIVGLLALVAIVVVWKLLAGVIKTVALVAILIAVAIYMFGVGA